MYKLKILIRKHFLPSLSLLFENVDVSMSSRQLYQYEVEKCGIVYSLSCKKCNKEYVDETARTLETRFKEHTDGKHPSSAICEHLSTSGPGHCVEIKDAKILARENNNQARKIKEAIQIHKRLPVLNRDAGADIPPIMLNLLSILCVGLFHHCLLQ